MLDHAIKNTICCHLNSDTEDGFSVIRKKPLMSPFAKTIILDCAKYPTCNPFRNFDELAAPNQTFSYYYYVFIFVSNLINVNPM